MSALGTGLLIGTGVTLIGAVAAWALIQRAPTGAEDPTAAVTGASPATAGASPVAAEQATAEIAAA